MKTFAANEATVDRRWYVIDAENETLGRLASVAASMLRGKHKPDFTPNVDTGDFIIVINAEKITVTGKKMVQKLYSSHSGYPGGFRQLTLQQMMDRTPERVIEKAVWGMVPHTRLGRRQITKLKVFTGSTHSHEAQKPVLLDLKAAATLKIQQLQEASA
jgi:large subunit ribosomal protein L13